MFRSIELNNDAYIGIYVVDIERNKEDRILKEFKIVNNMPQLVYFNNSSKKQTDPKIEDFIPSDLMKYCKKMLQIEANESLKRQEETTKNREKKKLNQMLGNQGNRNSP